METNPYKLDRLQKVAMSLMGVLMIITFVGANLHALLWQSSDWLVSTVLPAVVVDLTNKERAGNNAQLLQRNTTLDAAAQKKAEHMAKNEYFAHYSPDGVSPWHWFKQVDYTYAHAGENLAIHFTDSAEVVEAWMDSPAHRANIVNDHYTEIGVGTAKGTYEGYDTVYVVQLFGTPAVKPEVIEKVEIPAPTPIAAVPVATAEVVEETEVATSALSTLTEESADLPIAVIESAAAQELVVSTSPSYQITDDVVIIESPTIATSSGLAIAQIVSKPPTTHAGVTLGSVATQPNSLLQIIYFVLGGIVCMLLSVSIVWEVKKLRVVQVVYGVLLLVGMGGLWYAHMLLTQGAVVV